MICLLVGRWKGGPFATGELQQTNDKGGVAWQKLQESESWRNINQMHVKLSYFPHTYPRTSARGKDEGKGRNRKDGILVGGVAMSERMDVCVCVCESECVVFCAHPLTLSFLLISFRLAQENCSSRSRAKRNDSQQCSTEPLSHRATEPLTSRKP